MVPPVGVAPDTMFYHHWILSLPAGRQVQHDYQLYTLTQ